MPDTTASTIKVRQPGILGIGVHMEIPSADGGIWQVSACITWKGSNIDSFADVETALTGKSDKGGNSMKGIDVSKHNGNIDWNRVKNNGRKTYFRMIAKNSRLS